MVAKSDDVLGHKVAPSTLDALAVLWNSLPEYKVKPKTGMHYGMESKYVSWKFDPDTYPKIELIHITDIQYGHVECKVNKLIEYRDWILDSPNRFVLLGGDLIDSATIMSPGSPWDNICEPQSQIYKFCSILAPIRHRILGYVGGNHERRTAKTFGDSGLLISYLLRVPYSSGQQLIDIHFGEHKPFKIHLWHGSGSAKTKGAKAQLIDRQMQKGDAQLYLVGHLHDCMILPSVRILRDPSKNQTRMQKIYGAMSSSFLEWWGTYAEVAGLLPNSIMMIRAILEPNGGWEVTSR